jgi:hypothetical protein
MAVPTAQEMLDNVRIAINTRIANGAVQSYTLAGGRNVQSFSLDELLALEKSLVSRVAAESGTTGGGRTHAAFRNLD